MWKRRVARGDVRGQIIIGVGLALFAMFGLMGLVFDVGWSVFIEKEAQAAADAAAMATAIDVLERIGAAGPFDCTDPAVFCGNATACAASPPIGVAPTNSLEAGCQYARRNGFWIGNPDHDQNVRLAANAAAPGSTIEPPAAPGANVFYWATAMTAQETPQIFSALQGNTMGLVSASATAAIVESIVPGTLWLLNRENDPVQLGPPSTSGGNMYVNSTRQGCNGGNCGPNGGYSVRVAGRVVASSQLDGSGSGPDDFAAVAKGNATILSDDFLIRGSGDYSECPNCLFDVEPQNGGDPLGSIFRDPTEGKPNPPLPGPLVFRPIPNGDVGSLANCGGSGIEGDPFILMPGIYYSYRPGNQNQPPIADGQAITLGNAHYRFGDCSGGTFGDFVFLGGLELSGTNLEYGPGRYVYAGAARQGSNPGRVWNTESGAFVTDGLTPNVKAPAGNAGQLHVLAGPEYVGADGRSLINLINGSTAAGGGPGGENVQNLANLLTDNVLDYGTAEISLGNNTGSLLNLHGLNPDGDLAAPDGLPPELEPYRKFTIWQDRDNSVIDYNFDGSYNCPSPSGACPQPAGQGPSDSSATELDIQASPNVNLYGIIYQPRGSFVTMTGGGDYSGPLQIVTGAFRVTGNAVVDLNRLPEPLTTRLVALVQ